MCVHSGNYGNPIIHLFSFPSFNLFKPFPNYSIACSAQKFEVFQLKSCDTLELTAWVHFFFGIQLYTKYVAGRKVLKLLMSHGLFGF